MQSYVAASSKAISTEQLNCYRGPLLRKIINLAWCLYSKMTFVTLNLLRRLLVEFNTIWWQLFFIAPTSIGCKLEYEVLLFVSFLISKPKTDNQARKQSSIFHFPADVGVPASHEMSSGAQRTIPTALLLLLARQEVLATGVKQCQVNQHFTKLRLEFLFTWLTLHSLPLPTWLHGSRN